jgi:hypothetical protein
LHHPLNEADEWIKTFQVEKLVQEHGAKLVAAQLFEQPIRYDHTRAEHSYRYRHRDA